MNYDERETEAAVEIDEHAREAVALEMLAASIVAGDVPLRTDPGWERAWYDYFRRQRAERAAAQHWAHILRHQIGDLRHDDGDSPQASDLR